MTPQVRVLHVVSDTNFGGAGRYLLTLLERPEYTAKAMCTIACPQGLLWDRLREMGVACHELSGGDRSLDPGQIPSLFSLVSTGKYDIVHTHASLTARLVARFFPGVKIVFTKHTMDRPGSRGRFSGLIQRVLAHRVICPSRAVLAQMEELGLPSNMLDLIYNGVPAEEMRQSLASLQDIGCARRQDSIIIASSGRLEPEKGHEFLIRAMPRVLLAYPGARLVIAGDGSLRGYLADLAQNLGISEAIGFPGFLPDVLPLLSKASVFVLPSLYEALGISLLEAMALGVTCIGTSVGGIPEVLTDGETGFLVSPEDPDAISQRVLQVLGDRELSERLSSNAARDVDARFSAKTQAEKTVLSYLKAQGR